MKTVKIEYFLKLGSLALLPFFFFPDAGLAATLKIKRNFSHLEGHNSQNVPLLNEPVFTKKLRLNKGGPSPVSYGDGVLSVSKTPLVEPKEIKHSQKEIQRKNRYYTVLKGDTVLGIAKKFGVSKDTIIWENNIKNNLLKVGQELTILPASGISYKIKKGDTLSGISKKYNISISKIKEFNTISEKGLQIGQKIFLPGASKKSEAVIKKASSNKKASYISRPSKIAMEGDGNISRYIN